MSDAASKPAGQTPVHKTTVNRGFVAGAPDVQQTIDQFTWASKLPIPGTTSGKSELFDDSRIRWLLENIPTQAPFSVLELGPLEGGHSAMLAAAGGQVRAVEANVSAYVKCLVVKDLLGLDTVEFLLGDFNADMAENERRYDLLLASGVLYHMADPVGTICNMTNRADTVFVWTHYFDKSKMSLVTRGVKGFWGKKKLFSYRGSHITGEVRRYGPGARLARFWGGSQPMTVWLAKSDIYRIFAEEGFEIIEGLDEPDHPNGPAVYFLAQRKAA